jgi:hypothetical protein
MNLRGSSRRKRIADVLAVGAPISVGLSIAMIPDEVATVYEGLIERIGMEKTTATKIGLKVIGDRMPTHEQFRGAIAGRRTVVRLQAR